MWLLQLSRDYMQGGEISPESSSLQLFEDQATTTCLSWA